jgi:hypothetical protein
MVQAQKRILKQQIFSFGKTYEEVEILINEFCVIDFCPFADMNEFDVWKARFSENLILQIKEKFRTDVPKQHLLCFYLIMASMGVL